MNNIAVLGPKGTFSDCAADKYLDIIEEDMNRLYYPAIADVFHAVGAECDFGIVPVENTLDGYVQRSLDLLLEMNLRIVKEIIIPVQFSLVSNTDNENSIEKLYVQFKANGQCRKFIEKLSNVQIITTDSNMESYNLVQKGIKGEGAIIPRHMLKSEAIQFGIENVTDSGNNYTRFLIVRPWDNTDVIEVDKSIKAALYIMSKIDRPGLLFEILKEFSENNINLISIMSRPTKKNMGTYNFYIELSGSHKDKTIITETLNKIEDNYDLKILGIYSV